MKVIGFFMFIYGWFTLYDAGLSFEGTAFLLGGLAIVMYEEILPRVEILFRRNHNE